MTPIDEAWAPAPSCWRRLATAGDGAGTRPSISADGARVGFASTATNLATDGNAAVKDVFARDIGTSPTQLVSVVAAQASTDSDHAAVAADGGLMAFVFTDPAVPPGTRLISTDANLTPDVFAEELTPTDTTAPALSLGGPAEGLSQIASQVPIGGSVSGASGVASLTVNGVPRPLTATGGFSTSLPLVPGPNAIVVTATDGARRPADHAHPGRAEGGRLRRAGPSRERPRRRVGPHQRRHQDPAGQAAQEVGAGPSGSGRAGSRGRCCRGR